MAKDAKTRELLTRLHGGWPTELVVIDAEHTKDQAAFKAMPPEGVAVVLRVADLNRKDVTSTNRWGRGGHTVSPCSAAAARLPRAATDCIRGR